MLVFNLEKPTSHCAASAPALGWIRPITPLVIFDKSLPGNEAHSTPSQFFFKLSGRFHWAICTCLFVSHQSIDRASDLCFSSWPASLALHADEIFTRPWHTTVVPSSKWPRPSRTMLLRWNSKLLNPPPPKKKQTSHSDFII